MDAQRKVEIDNKRKGERNIEPEFAPYWLTKKDMVKKHINLIAAKEGETWVNRFASIIKHSLSSAIHKRHSLMVVKTKASQ